MWEGWGYGCDFAPRGHLAISGDFSAVTAGEGGATGTRGVAAVNSAKHRTVHRTGISNKEVFVPKRQRCRG